MAEKLPEPTKPAIMGSAQAALFEDPTRLRNMSDRELLEFDADFMRALNSNMPQIRRWVGLMAWVQWHRMTDGRYAGWVIDVAAAVGVSGDTIKEWRRKVTASDKLALPTAAEQRSKEQKTARQRRSGGEIPPAITTTASAPDPEEASPPAPPVRTPSPPRSEPQTVVPPGGGQVGGPPTARQAVVRFLGVLRCYDPAELGAAMTAEEGREVRAFAAKVEQAWDGLDLPPPRLTPPIVRRPSPSPNVKPKRHAPGCQCGVCVEPKAKR